MFCLLKFVPDQSTVYPKKYAHGFVVLCFVVVMRSFIMNSHEVFIHIHQGCFAGTGAIVRLSQCQWSKPDGYRKISQSITTTKHSKEKTVCIFLGRYCICNRSALCYIIVVYSNKPLHYIMMTQLPGVGVTKAPFLIFRKAKCSNWQGYTISQEICTRFCCALLCCGYAIVHNEFTWSIYPYSSGLLCWHWGNR